MSVQVRVNTDITPFYLSGGALYDDNSTVLQDAGRSGNMVFGTVMSKNPATNKWVPFTDETAVDGTQLPLGILLETLTEADIQAGDITGVNILRAGIIVDRAKLVVENSKTLATVITSADMRVDDFLSSQGIRTATTVDTTGYENA